MSLMTNPDITRDIASYHISIFSIPLNSLLLACNHVSLLLRYRAMENSILFSSVSALR